MWSKLCAFVSVQISCGALSACFLGMRGVCRCVVCV